MKDYEQIVQDLKKENFDLKLRVHLLEERLSLTGPGGPIEEAQRRVIDLKVESESLRRDLSEKNKLLQDALDAIDSLEIQYKDDVTKLRADHEAERVTWVHRLELVQKVSEGAGKITDQGCQIESKSSRILLSNRLLLQRSNRIKCRSNRKTFSIFDTIRSGRKCGQENSEL
jgi:hypothetical protein